MNMRRKKPDLPLPFSGDEVVALREAFDKGEKIDVKQFDRFLRFFNIVLAEVNFYRAHRYAETLRAFLIGRQKPHRTPRRTS